jgi:HAE1 family hydrophobic/amphiphilic exporter-1
MQLIQAFVRNPVKVAVGVLLVALFGVIGFLRMPKQLTPEVEIPKISIETRWPGASPQEVEREIVQEQEEFLQSVEGVTKMSATCADSMGTITLEFAVGTDLSEALLKVNARLQQVPEYPEEADQPVISTSDPRANAIAWFILRPRVPTTSAIVEFQQQHADLAQLLEPARMAQSTGLRARRLEMLAQAHPEIVDQIQPLLPPDIDVSELGRFAEDFIEARFERVRGVSNANAYGGREEEMQVIVDPEELAARHLTILGIRNALRQQNRDISGGDLWEGKRRYVIRTLGRFTSPDQVGDIILLEGDAPVYLRDVAEIHYGYKKPTAIVKSFGTVCLAINCVRETGANVLETMDGLREAAAELNRDLLKRRGLELVQSYDETEYINSSIHLVTQNIWVGGLLTISVLLLFLRSGRSTLVIALAIPTSLIGTFLLLNLMGRSLNVISLAGLAFAVGMLVDNAVVVLENCYRHAQLGDNPFAAAVRGAQEVWGAVVASTLTTLAVFLPVLFVQEEAGQLFRDIALAISCAVGLSLIVSISVIPVAAARLLGSTKSSDEPAEAVSAKHRRWLAWLDRWATGSVDRLIAVLSFIQRRTWVRVTVVMGMVFLALVLSYVLMPQVEYLPAGTRNLVIGMMLPPPGYNIDQALELGIDIEQATQSLWDVDPQDPTVANGEVPAIADYFFVARTQMIFFGVRAMRPEHVNRLIGIMQGVAAQIPGAIPMISRRALFSSELGAGRTRRH